MASSLPRARGTATGITNRGCLGGEYDAETVGNAEGAETMLEGEERRRRLIQR
jgi:hypothetical protein